MRLIIIKSSDKFFVKKQIKKWWFFSRWYYLYAASCYDNSSYHWKDSIRKGESYNSISQAQEAIEKVLQFHELEKEVIVWDSKNITNKNEEKKLAITDRMIKAHLSGDFEQEELLLKELLKIEDSSIR